MQIAIIVSKQDLAGMNIKESLISDFGFQKSTGLFDSNPVFTKSIAQASFSLFTLNELHLFSDNLDSQIQADFIVFASKHKGNVPCFSVHAPGNFSDAEFGGKVMQISLASALLNKNLLLALFKNAAKSGFTRSVCLEVNAPWSFIDKYSLCFY